jgi:hypothetical protein
MSVQWALKGVFLVAASRGESHLRLRECWLVCCVPLPRPLASLLHASLFLPVEPKAELGYAGTAVEV